MKIVIAPDSFKGTISSMEFCAIVEQSILKSLPDTQVVRIPIADGGEGMVDAYLQSNGGDKVSLEVTGPNFAKVCARCV